MKALAGVHVLIAGKEDDNFTSVTTQLLSLGASVQTRSCKEVTVDFIASQQIKLIILNHLQDHKICTNIAIMMRDDISGKSIPVFILVDDSIDDIQNALVQGAADYITKSEGTESIIQKITAVLQGDDMFSNSEAFDITPEKAEVFSTGIRVYVVEDDPLLRNLLAIKLNKSFFPHEFSKNGDGAVANMKRFKPDTIILDLMLPGMSGFDILASLKKEPDLKDVPVIVFSNKDGSEDRLRAKELGANCFYVKAMTDLSELVEKIEALVLEKKA